MDCTEKNLKTVFKTKRRSKHGFEEQEPLQFRTADMNDPDVLKSFLYLMGIPYRPYDDIM